GHGRMRTTALLAATALCSGLLAQAGCTGPEDEGDPEDSVFVDEGKADDFFSTSAVEYILEGRTSVTLDPSFATASDEVKLAEVKKLIGYKQIAIAWFLTQYLVAKEHDAENASFGGFSGLAKAGAFEDLDVEPRADGLTYDF